MGEEVKVNANAQAPAVPLAPPPEERRDAPPPPSRGHPRKERRPGEPGGESRPHGGDGTRGFVRPERTPDDPLPGEIADPRDADDALDAWMFPKK